MTEGAQYSLDFLFNSKGAEKSVARLGTVAGRASEKLKEMVSQKGYLYYSIKRIASYTAIFTFFAALTRSIGDVVRLELRLAEVNTLIDKTNKDAVASFNEVTGALLKLDPHLGNAINLTKGLYEIISAGVTDPQEAFDLLVVSAKYAKVGLTDLATASSSLTAVMKAYGFTAEAMRAKSDVLFASVREGKFHTDELNAAIGKVLPTAATMNVSIEEVATALAVMTQRGLDVNEASTSLNRMLISFLRPIDKAKARFEALGWEYGRNAFQSVTLTGALQRLEIASARYGDLLPIIFRRQRALKGGFILQGEGLRSLEQMFGRVSSAGEGAGIIQAEYGNISRTVAMEVEALGANLAQGMANLLKYKGAVSGVVREISTFLRGVVEGLPTIAAFGSAILFVMKIMKIMRSEFVYTAIAQTALNKATLAGATAQRAKAAAIKVANKATKAASVVLGAVNIVLIAALVVYTAVVYWINRKKKAEQDAASAAEAHEKVQAGVNRELAIMAEAWEKATGEVRNFGAEIEEALGERDLIGDAYKKIWELAGGPQWAKAKKVLKELKDATKLTGEEWKHGWMALKKNILHMEMYEEDTKQLIPLLRRLAEGWGWVSDEQEKLAKNLKESSPEYVKTLMEMSQQTGKLARDMKLAKQELYTDKQTLALRYTKAELLGMADALVQIKGGLTPLQKEQLVVFGVDPDVILEDLKRLEIALYNFNAASVTAWGDKAAERIEDYTRTYLASGEKIRFSFDRAEEGVTAMYNAFHELRLEDEKDILAWANEHKAEVEKMLRHAEGLEPRYVKFLNMLEDARKKDKKGAIDWGQRYKDAMDMVVDDSEKIGSKIQLLKNKYREEEHLNAIESFEREKISYINHADKLVEIAIASGDNIEAAKLRAELTYTQIAEWGMEARKVAAFEEVQNFMKAQKETLNSMKQTANERIAMTENLEADAIAFLKSMDVEGEFFEFLSKMIHDYFQNIRDDTEAGISKLKEYEQFFSALGTSVSAVATDLADFLNEVGLGDSTLSRFANALKVVGEGASNFAKHLKAISEAKDLEGEDGLSGFLGAVGKIGGQIGAVITIAKTAYGVVQALFGGKTEQQKKEAEDARILREQNAMISQMKENYASLGELSDGMAKKLAELRQGGMAGWLAEAKLLNEIMNDIGVNAKNFNEWGKRTVDILYNIRDGFIDAEEGAGIIGEAFNTLTTYAEKFGKEGSRAILEIIWKAREMGVVVPEIAEYVAEKLNLAAAGLAKGIIWVAKDAVEAHNAIQDLTSEKRKLLREVERIQSRMSNYTVGSEQYREAADRLKELSDELADFDDQIEGHQKLIDAHGKETKNHIDNLGIITSATFNAMLQSGRPLLEVLSEMSEGVFALMDRYKALGMEVPSHLKSIFKVFNQYKKTPEFFEGLQGIGEAMKGLGDSGFLTVDAFAALNKEAKSYYTQMTKTKKEGGFGFTDEQAIRMMYPMLQQMWWYAEQYGMKLPKWAKEAMKEAKGLGLKFEKPAVERQLEIAELTFEMHRTKMGRMVDLLADIRGELRGTESFQFGTPNTKGGFAHLHPGESVLPENVTSALKQFFMGKNANLEGGGGGTAVVPVYIDGQLVYRAMVPYLKKGGDYSDFELSGDGVF